PRRRLQGEGAHAATHSARGRHRNGAARGGEAVGAEERSEGQEVGDERSRAKAPKRGEKGRGRGVPRKGARLERQSRLVPFAHLLLLVSPTSAREAERGTTSVLTNS